MDLHVKERAVVEAHLRDEVAALALKASRFPGIDFAWVLRQIAGYQAIERKLPSWYAQKGLEFPASLPLEQCSSEQAAVYKRQLLSQTLVTSAGGHLHGADLTGGLGVDACFLSPLFETYDYVERQEGLCRLARHNFTVLGRDNVRVLHQSAEDYLQQAAPLDFVFLDPARRDGKGRKVAALSDCEPDVLLLLPLLREKARHVLLKLSPMLDISLALKQLPQTTQVHVVAVDNECRELLLLVDCQVATHARPYCRTVNLRAGRPVQEFGFFLDEMGGFEPRIASTPGTWLYEPNAALMKSGGHGLAARELSLGKLHPNSQLYTGDSLWPDYPGRIFRVKEALNPSGKDTRRLLTGAGYSVCVRNYPESPDEIRKKYKLKEDPRRFLFATTLGDGRHVLLSCERQD